MQFQVKVEREEGGRWIAEVPALPGVLTYGATREQAIDNANASALSVLSDPSDESPAD